MPLLLWAIFLFAPLPAAAVIIDTVPVGNAGNAGELLGVAEVNGALVGGASLTAKAFMPIVKAAG